MRRENRRFISVGQERFCGSFSVDGMPRKNEVAAGAELGFWQSLSMDLCSKCAGQPTGAPSSSASRCWPRLIRCADWNRDGGSRPAARGPRRKRSPGHSMPTIRVDMLTLGGVGDSFPPRTECGTTCGSGMGSWRNAIDEFSPNLLPRLATHRAGHLASCGAEPWLFQLGDGLDRRPRAAGATDVARQCGRGDYVHSDPGR